MKNEETSGFLAKILLRSSMFLPSAFVCFIFHILILQIVSFYWAIYLM